MTDSLWRNILTAIIFATLPVLATSVAVGSTFLATTDEQLAAASDVVLTGEVVQTHVRRGSTSGRISTVYTVAVDTVLSGSLPGTFDRTVTFALPGGETADQGQVVAGVPRFRVGDSIQVFLKDRAGRRAVVDDVGPGHVVTGMGLGARRLGQAAAGQDFRGALVDRYTFYPLAEDVFLRWYTDTIDVYIDSAMTPDINDDLTLREIQLSMDEWNGVDCVHPYFSNRGTVSDVDPFEKTATGTATSGNNLIIFENMDEWDANREDQDEFDASRTVALSTMFHQPGTGEITSFALEMNDDRFGFAVTGLPAAIDLRNTLTHELGHILGLDHTGTDIPEYWAQTMYFETASGETQKRSLEQDDRDGLCELYASEWKDNAGGCSASPHNDDPRRIPYSVLVLLGCVLIICVIRRVRPGIG